MTIDSRDATAVDAELRRAFASLPAPSTPGHPSEDDWARYAAGEMSSDERTQVADHVVSCAECATIFRVLALVGTEVKGTVAHRQPSMGDRRVLALAAAVVLTVGLGAWWAVRTRVDDPGQRAGAEPPPIAAPVEAAVAPSTLWASLPAPPEVRLHPDLVLTMRGAEAERDGFLKVFGEAIAPYRAGRFAEAAAALAPVAERYANIAEVWFYLGTARLYGGAAAAAIEPLRRAQSSEVVGDEARWLQAVALQRAGRDREARAALQVICSAPGPHREQACAVVTP